jgi:hypothetical protein
MKRHHVVCGFVFLFVLLATTQTQAKTQINLSDQGKVNKRVVFVSRGELLRFANQAGLMVRTIKISKRDLAKLASSGPKGCGCLAVPQEMYEFGFGGCFKDCLIKYSNATVAALCGGACIAAGTGNPVAIGACAACIGIEEWIVAGCSLKCVWYSAKNVAPKIPHNFRRSQTPGENSARLSLNTTSPVSVR